MSDDRPQRPVTSMSLRAERLRHQMARAAGARLEHDDPGLSKVAAPRDPELRNPTALIGFGIGIFALFLDPLALPSIAAVVLCLLGLRQANLLARRGKERFGRSRAVWGLGFAVFAAIGYVFLGLSKGLF